MPRIDFPDETWIDVRDPAEVPEKVRRPYLAAGAVAASAPDLEAQTNATRRAQTVGAVAVITAWSWDTPVSVEALEDLPSMAFDRIIDATESRRDGLRWSLIVTPEAMADPKAPSVDSTSSGPGWATPTP